MKKEYVAPPCKRVNVTDDINVTGFTWSNHESKLGDRRDDVNWDFSRVTTYNPWTGSSKTTLSGSSGETVVKDPVNPPAVADFENAYRFVDDLFYTIRSGSQVTCRLSRDGHTEQCANAKLMFYVKGADRVVPDWGSSLQMLGNGRTQLRNSGSDGDACYTSVSVGMGKIVDNCYRIHQETWIKEITAVGSGDVESEESNYFYWGQASGTIEHHMLYFMGIDGVNNCFKYVFTGCPTSGSPQPKVSPTPGQSRYY